MGHNDPRQKVGSIEYQRDYPILYVDDEEPNLVVFRGSFGEEFDLVTASSGEAALRILSQRRIAVLLADHRMRDMTGIELCEAVRERHPTVQRILVTAYSDQKTAIDAINRGGVSRYLAKPWRLEEVRQVLHEAVERAHLESTVRSLSAEILDRERLATLAAMRARLLHDLANVNMAIQGSAQRLEGLVPVLRSNLDTDLFLQVQDAVSNLRMAVDHMTMLHQKREQAARLSPASKNYWSVMEILESVRELTRAEVSLSARLVIQCPQDLVVWADRTDVCRILMNLLTNAAHAIESTGVRDGEIRVRAVAEGSSVLLEVSDNGPGVPHRLSKRIFEPAFTTRSDRGGSGLGLAICRELALANDGTVDLVEPGNKTKENTGATFQVRLPSRPQRGT
ncbi:hybrid sensor histidine kinase/response regulator [Myxococcota bacterium]|jgi:signal transduction histidine kinase|nr:hybrid sensor histidine kinase/response regulator [Myxococcota bacterium]